MEYSFCENVLTKLVTSPKLIVAVNTLPLYFITQMYLPGTFQKKVQLVQSVFSQILAHHKQL